MQTKLEANDCGNLSKEQGQSEATYKGQTRGLGEVEISSVKQAEIISTEATRSESVNDRREARGW